MLLKKIIYIKILILIIFSFTTWVAKATDVWWTIAANTTWALADSPYYITSSLTLNAWYTLTIEPWVVIKVNNWLTLNINWVIDAQWTLGNEIVFTSINDWTVWWSIWWTWTPASWNWSYFKITWSWTNWSILDYIKIKYWGSTIENSAQSWIYVATWSPTITNNNILNNTSDWIYILAWTPAISWNTIQNNTQYWINSYSLQIRVAPNDVAANNTVSSNTLWNVASRWMDIASVWTIDWSVHDIVIIWVWALASWKTLTIAPWTIIKVNNWIALNINWVIDAQWTLGNEIVFTSINDWTVWWSTWWTWTPASWNWSYFKITWSWTNWSILDYIKIKYWGAKWSYPYYYKALWLSSTNTIVKNSLIEDSQYYPLFMDWTTNSTIENTTIRNSWYHWIYTSATWSPTITWSTIENSAQSWIYVATWSPTITNNNILNNTSDWIYIWNWSPSITNNIIKDNTRYWIYGATWTPIITYNLFHNNTSADTYNLTLDWSNIIWSDPLLDPITQQLSVWSPAINMWDPALWNHPITWDRYDIWRYEYTWFAMLSFSADLTWISWRSLTYQWSFLEDPTNWVNTPSIWNNNWTITVDSNISCNFQVEKLWNYTLKLVIKEWETILWEWTNSFTIVGP